jgi:arylsulfatase A-like enzyme
MNRRGFLKYMGLAGVAALTDVADAGMSFKNKTLKMSVGRRPANVIYIMTDDQGYGDVGCYGQQLIKTPSLDKMAAEGMRFTDHYSGTCICAPTRCVLMTGLHTGHSYIRDNYETGGYQLPIPDETLTVAEVFKQQGYATGCVGKWGLGGPNSMGHPNNQGFDLFFGYLGQVQAHDYYPDYLWRNDEKIYLDGAYSHDAMTDEILNFITANKDRPFFLYIPWTIPHTKFQVPQDSLDQYADEPWTSDQKKQAAMISRMDRDVGRIIDLLKQLGIDDNTVMSFTSDNGPHGSSGTNGLFNANGPFRGIKRDLYEGGIRVPFIVRWPGTIRPGTTSDHVSAFWDFFPTACDLIGAATPQGLDGISYVPAILGIQQQQHEYLYWEFKSQGGKQAVRMGKWKGVRLNVRTNPDPALQLYDLQNDIAESTDVGASNPDIVAQIEQIMTDAHTYNANFKLLYGE